MQRETFFAKVSKKTNISNKHDDNVLRVNIFLIFSLDIMQRPTSMIVVIIVLLFVKTSLYLEKQKGKKNVA